MTAYIADTQLRAAVERELEIVGEATAQLARLDPQTVQKITAYPEIIAFRNQLVHAYSRTDARVVWDVLQDHLPLVLNEVRALLRTPET